MAVNTKIIKNRISSIGNTKKITKAMEMISAVKMRKATEAAVHTREYARMGQYLLSHLSLIEESHMPLLQVRKVKKLLVILVSSNRGLCGSFNSNIFKKARHLLHEEIENLITNRIKNGEEIKGDKNEVEISMIGIGKKSAYFAKKYGYNLISVYDNLSDNPDFDDVLPIANFCIEEYKKNNYDKVAIFYTDFRSTLSQIPKVRQILPLSEVELEKMISGAGSDKQKQTPEVVENVFEIENYLFEPGVEEIIETIVPKLVEIQVYQAVLESVASEHSARMMAMRNANESAGEMIEELNLSFNKARQAGITQEIAEIAGGAAALE